MNDSQGENRQIVLGALIFTVVVILALSIQGCQYGGPEIGDNAQPIGTMDLASDFVPTPVEGGSTQVVRDPTKEMREGFLPVWENFPPPSIDPATPIPPPLKDLRLSDEVLVWVLLGSDTEPPFMGRTEAIHLVFIHPRFSKASLVSIPGDLYVYIPGYTMQRLNTAYALGGIKTLRETLVYNFGLTPSRFILAHPGDFQWLVDDIQGIDVTVFYPMPQACGGIRAGLVKMDGALALCYASYRDGMDEVDRMRRQQQLLRLIFQKFASDGNLIQLPVLYASYEGWVITDLSLTELMGYIPLTLRLADRDRISYYMFGWEQIRLWEIPGYSQAQVFLPDQDAIKEVLQQAIADVMVPSPLTNQVQTLEAQLTAAYLATLYPIDTPTPTITPTPTLTPTITATFEGTATIEGTATVEGTATIEETVISETPSPTATETPPGYPYP